MAGVGRVIYAFRGVSLGMIPRAFIVCKINRIERMEFMLVEIIGKQNEEQLITTSRKVAEKLERNTKAFYMP